MTESERIEAEYRLEETYQEWKLCQKVYQNSPGAIWLSTFHWDDNLERHGRRPRYIDMRFDLGRNNCHYILRRIGYK